jgi:hypothetical protein
MGRMAKAVEATKSLPSQSAVEIRRGMHLRRTRGGIPVVRLHYSVIPARDPKLHPEWRLAERKTYTSQAAWDREQEIIDEAGGGELVFADALITHWKKIVIEDPKWRPDPNWRAEGGFDHGKTNPTVLERCYADYNGTFYLCGEYYVPGKEVWQHAPALAEMPDIRKLSTTFADPTIFDAIMQQSNQNQPTQAGKAAERARSINELYIEQGVELFSPFFGDRSDISFAQRLLLHWSNLEEREPTVKIVCRNYIEKPVPGLHPWDCPNLLWELMRTRRVKLTAQQLLSRNTSEAIVDKDNHARDAMKYILMSHPEPAGKSRKQLAAEAVKPLAEAGDLTSAMVRYQQMTSVPESQPIRIGRRRR